jgi:2-keto-4-pentenoate hydratase
MGRDFPIDAENMDVAALQSAIAECFVSLEIVGRRVGDDVPLTELSSLADFALDVAVVRGGPIHDWKHRDLCNDCAILKNPPTNLNAPDRCAKKCLLLICNMHIGGA